MAKNSKKNPKKREIKKLEKKKFNKYTIYLGTFVLIVILLLVIYYSSFIQDSKEPERFQEIQTPSITGPEIVAKGFCKRDSECFITTCKDTQIKDCVNTTQLTDYHENCKSYSYWVVEQQDPSECACIQNLCKTIK